MNISKRPKNPQKIAFMGNMNNNFFAIARYLRDHEINSTLFLFSDQLDHFHPSCDTYNLDFRNWTNQLTWGNRTTFLDIHPDLISDALGEFSLRVGCGLAPAICYRSKLPLEVFVPYGGDLWSETKYSFNRPLDSCLATTYAQRVGLANVSVVHAPEMISSYESILRRYWQGKNRWYEGVPMVYAPEYSIQKLEMMIERSQWGHEFRRIRESCEFMLVSHCRHHWGSITDPASKGNEVLLEGWSKFIRFKGRIRAKLVLIEYGKDVARSKEKAIQLGITETIEWMPKMNRKDLMPGLLIADAVAGEFVHTWNAGGVIYEALVARKPIIMKHDESQLLSYDKNFFPVFKADNPDDVATHLVLLSNNPTIAQEAGEAGFHWYEDTVVNRSIKRYLELT